MTQEQLKRRLEEVVAKEIMSWSSTMKAIYNYGDEYSPCGCAYNNCLKPSHKKDKQ